MTVLVTGATGQIGRLVIERLLDAGATVRALSRAPARAALPTAVEVVAGDLTIPSSLDGVFDGVEAAHLLAAVGDDYGPNHAAAEVVAEAERAGVQRVTVLWRGDVGPLEHAVAASRLEWTRLEPPEFMSNSLHWAESIRSEGVVREPYADVLGAVVDEADVAAVAAAILLDGGQAGRVLTPTGPEALTPPQRVAALAAATGREIRFVELTDAQARERWRASGHTEELIELLAGYHSAPPPESYTVSPIVEQVTGRPPRSFAAWAQEHADVFGRVSRPAAV